MKKWILNWLFGTDNVQRYMEVLRDCRDTHQNYLDEIEDHIKSLKEDKEHIKIILKLIQICENHGIDVNKEFAQIDNIK